MNFICLIGEKSIEATIQTYRALKRPNDYYVTEAQLNSLGYRLLEVKKVSEAIDIFRLSVEAYPPPSPPTSATAAGEASMSNGELRGAILSICDAPGFLVISNTHAANVKTSLAYLSRRPRTFGRQRTAGTGFRVG